MHDWQSLSHVRWECKYHVVIIPKYRKRVFYGKLRRQIGPILRESCRQKGIELLEGHCMPEHVPLWGFLPHTVWRTRWGISKGRVPCASIGSCCRSAG